MCDGAWELRAVVQLILPQGHKGLLLPLPGPLPLVLLLLAPTTRGRPGDISEELFSVWSLSPDQVGVHRV